MTGDDEDARTPCLRDYDGQERPHDAAHHGVDSVYQQARTRAKVFLASKSKHYAIMGLVSLDVLVLLTDIFVALIACDIGQKDERWVEQTREGLHLAGLIFSGLFMLELLLCVWSFGFG
jgi:hypothetical protein